MRLRPSSADLRAAEIVVGQVAVRTPCLPSKALSKILGGPVYLKCENLQRTGSFKLRGAYFRLSRLRAVGGREVVAASAGNHAQGVARAARELGMTATVFMPSGAVGSKVAACRELGAAVHLVGEHVEDAVLAARDFAKRSGQEFVHPFEHPDLIAGQATAGLEIFDQVPKVASIVLPVGGGGLVAGVIVAGLARRPSVQVHGVQPIATATLAASLAAGRPVRVEGSRTIADGVAVRQLGADAFCWIETGLHGWTTVSDAELTRAMAFCADAHDLVAEPAGACAVAAVLAGDLRPRTPAVLVVSGGNVATHATSQLATLTTSRVLTTAPSGAVDHQVG